MADLGSRANVIADLSAKVTTNGANENTGARVRAFLTNFIDTIWAIVNAHAVSISNLITASNGLGLALDAKADAAKSTFSKLYTVQTSGGLATVNAEDDFATVTGVVCMDADGEFLIPGTANLEIANVAVVLNVPATITLAGLPMNASTPIQDGRTIKMLVFGTPV